MLQFDSRDVGTRLLTGGLCYKRGEALNGSPGGSVRNGV